MDIAPKLADAVDDGVDVVIKAEIAGGGRYVAGVRPIGNIHVVIRQHRLHRAPQQGGVVAGHWRHNQHLRVVRAVGQSLEAL